MQSERVKSVAKDGGDLLAAVALRERLRPEVA
jgi:hypothetical protein